MIRIYHFRALIQALALAAGLLAAGAVHGQRDEFTARLAPLPVTFQTVDVITGLGQATAVWRDGHLHVEGTFRGLQAPATEAHLHWGAPAIPGPAFAMLEISGTTEGSVRGAVALTAEQRAALQNRGVYLQIHSQAAPAGNLRGWFFPLANN